MGTLKSIVRRAAHQFGVEIHSLNVHSSPAFQLLRGIEHFGITQVLDVGANVGQFSEELRSVGYDGDIVSFEPLAHAHAKVSAAARGDSRWTVHPRCAVGDKDGTIEINVAGNSVSSSILPMLETHSSVEATAAYIGVESVPICKLDSIAPQYLQNANPTLLKIDTQGFEWQVLDGASDILPRIQGVICELSLVPLYGGQHLWLDIIKRLEAAGFTLWTIDKGFTDPASGRSLQVDASFFRV
ncbi:MAG: FkbM family methyltransferase [Verrucomicrobia bacterium]|nr:FkbM family methyltransferase [Verrucomicrobiota bacterium]